MKGPGHFTRWPTLLASVTLVTAGLALDIADPASAPYAAACVALGSVAFGAFVYAEGARQRDWTDTERSRNVTPAVTDSDDTPSG